MTTEKRKPLTPVKPVGVELVFLFPCPFCQREVPVVAPVKPTLIACDACRGRFPIVPVDDRSVRFVKLMLGNGKAAVDPDFI